MSFSSTTYKQKAARAGRGDLHALESLLRDLGQHLETLSTTELGYLDGVTAGTLTASKALVVDASGILDTLTVTDLKCEVPTLSTGTTLNNSGISNMTSTGTRTFAQAAPEAGLTALLVCTATDTNAKAVALASGTYDGTNHIATLNGSTDAFMRVTGLSTSRFFIEEKSTSVVLSTQ